MKTDLESISCISFSENGSYLAVSGVKSNHSSKTIIFEFDSSTKKYRKSTEIQAGYAPQNPKKHIKCSISQNGEILAILDSSQETKIYRQNGAGGDQGSLSFLDTGITIPMKADTISVDKKGQFLAVTGGQEHAVSCFKIDRAKAIKVSEFKAHNREVTQVGLCDDQRLLISTSKDGTIKLLDVSKQNREALKGSNSTTVDNKYKRQTTGHSLKAYEDQITSSGGGITELKLSKNGKFMATCTSQGQWRVWQIEENNRLHTPIVSESGSVFSEHTIDVASNSVINLIAEFSHPRRYCKGPKIFAVSSQGRFIVTAEGAELKVMDLGKQGSADGTDEGNRNGEAGRRVRDSQGPRLKQVRALGVVQTIKGSSSRVTSLEFFSKEQKLLVGYDDKTTQIWRFEESANGFRKAGEVGGSHGSETALFISEDDHYLVLGSDQGLVEIWGKKTSNQTQNTSNESKSNLREQNGA